MGACVTERCDTQNTLDTAAAGGAALDPADLTLCCIYCCCARALVSCCEELSRSARVDHECCRNSTKPFGALLYHRILLRNTSTTTLRGRKREGGGERATGRTLNFLTAVLSYSLIRNIIKHVYQVQEYDPTIWRTSLVLLQHLHYFHTVILQPNVRSRQRRDTADVKRVVGVVDHDGGGTGCTLD